MSKSKQTKKESCKHTLVLPAYARVCSEGSLILSDFRCTKRGCKLQMYFKKVRS